MDPLSLIQGSAEWRRARVGSLGASCVHEVIARTKTGWGASRANRMAALIIERLTGEPQDGFTTPAMEWGLATEAEARAAYADRVIEHVTEVGLIPHPRIAGTHASPDGLVGDDGLLEIKCPQSATHLDILLTGKVPEKYVTQCAWQMACCERAWADFVSFDPRFPRELRLFVKRLGRDDERIAELEEQVSAFLAEVGAKVAELRRKFTLAEAA